MNTQAISDEDLIRELLKLRRIKKIPERKTIDFKGRRILNSSLKLKRAICLMSKPQAAAVINKVMKITDLI
jgi:hypothetical protein